jgi:hypothetical protein
MTFEWFYTLRLRLRSFFRRKQVDQELKDELRDHLEQQITENLAAGMSPEDALYSARAHWAGWRRSNPTCERYGVRDRTQNPAFGQGALVFQRNYYPNPIRFNLHPAP